MKKAAVFVEGQTELIFVKRLLEEIGGAHNICFQEERLHAKTYLTLQSDVVAGQQFFFLLIDCSADHAVLSAMRDRYAGLESQGYSLVLGLRDLYPLPVGDLPSLKAAIAPYLPAGSAAVHMTIAVTETEAWFVQEDRHFPIIDPQINRGAILADSQFDIENDFAETLPHPAKFLDKAYRLGQRRYTKKASNVRRTVAAIDFTYLYVDRRKRLTAFHDFCSKIDTFLGV